MPSKRYPHPEERPEGASRRTPDGDATPALPIVLVAAAALIDVDGRVLLAERPAGKHLAGMWEFPGGKVQAGETPEAALIRELREELGIDVHETCLAPFTFASYAYPEFHLLMPLYVCRKWQGIATPREGQRLSWVRPARLGDYPMPPADKPLVAMLRDLL
jgi:8-oxo-dGTP diphosphatase